MRIFILLGHPNGESFNGLLTDVYEQAAIARGHEVRRLDLGELHFNPALMPHAPAEEAPPPARADLRQSQSDLAWCDRLVLVYPMWWGHVPALLKSWFEHVLTAGFAFRYHDKDPWWDKLLAGREAHLIRTCDAPSLYARLWYRDADILCLRRAVLGFCGIKVRKVLRIGRVKYLDAKGRQRAIASVAAMV